RRLRLQQILARPPVASHGRLSGSDRAGAASACRRGLGGQGEPAGARDLARRAAPARARHRARRRAARAAARRARRGPLARGDAQDGGAGAHAQGPLHHRADRAQDGHHHERVGPHLGDALRRLDRRRHARGDTAQRGSAARLPGRRGRVILELQAIDTYYGLGHILHGLSMNVSDGEIVAVLGRNGAGKTTTLRSITGLTPPRKGEIRYKGRDIAGAEPHRVSRMGIALVPETRDIFSYLTVRENLAIARRAGSRWQMETVLERFPNLRDRMNNKGRQLSGGEQQMLAIARALLTGPDLLLLDEPSQGLAPLVVNDVMSTIRELRAERVSMLLVEQNAEMALQLADRVYVIDHGTVVFEGTPQALRADRQVAATYLGV